MISRTTHICGRFATFAVALTLIAQCSPAFSDTSDGGKRRIVKRNKSNTYALRNKKGRTIATRPIQQSRMHVAPGQSAHKTAVGTRSQTRSRHQQDASIRHIRALSRNERKQSTIQQRLKKFKQFKGENKIPRDQKVSRRQFSKFKTKYSPAGRGTTLYGLRSSYLQRPPEKPRTRSTLTRRIARGAGTFMKNIWRPKVYEKSGDGPRNVRVYRSFFGLGRKTTIVEAR